MFKKALVQFILLFTFCISLTHAQQNIITFKEAVAIKTFNFFTKNMFTPDPVENIMISNKFKTPEAGESIAQNGNEMKWEEIKADSAGWFENAALEGGYIYINYESNKKEIVLLEGMGHNLVYVNGELHMGNRYASKDTYESWEPRFDYSKIPIVLKKGKNKFLFQCSTGRFKVRLNKTGSGIFFNTIDSTLPDLLVGQNLESYGAVVVINATDKPMKEAKIIANGELRIENETPAGIIQPMSVRKIPFLIKCNAPDKKGNAEINLKIVEGKANKVLAETKINLRVVNPSENHKCTFISGVDGSVQYYSVNPARNNDGKPKALFLSVHGASVEAINQSGSYFPKTWGHIVSPTNRRPYGFNWEDWGRSDAMEVYNIALKTLNIDPDRIYLTGHSMGGHGAWHLGGTFPDKFAAIGPSAGWISFWSYRVRERNETAGEMEKMIMRATNPSDTYGIAENYKQLGVYVLHGGDDDNVPVTESRNMIEHLKKFQKDFVYHEQPKAGHWWDVSDEEGTDCVDWAPMFDYFARHALSQKEMIREIDFITANPGISSNDYWLTIAAQKEQLKMSRVIVRFDPGQNRFEGKTENAKKIAFDLSIVNKTKLFEIILDDQKLESISVKEDNDKIWLEYNGEKWNVSSKPNASEKNPSRYGTFKDVINHNVIFVYGTNGDIKENAWAFNKARFDAEQFWYQGNGSIEIVSDKDFNSTAEPNRNVLLYGNAETNLAWNKLLKNCPVQVYKGKIKVGEKEYKGKDIGCLFIYPRNGSDVACVGAVTGSGILGMDLTNRRLYLSPGYPFPDLILFNKSFTEKGIDGVLASGFFGLDWSLNNGEFVWK
jgi:predicted esterase